MSGYYEGPHPYGTSIRDMQPFAKGMDTDVDLAAVIATVNTNAYAVVNLVRPGPSYWERNGRRIFCKSLRVKGSWYYTCTGDGSRVVRAGLLRMVVVWDRQPYGVAPPFDDMFGTTSGTGVKSTEFLDPPAYDGAERFKVLRDVVWPTTAGRNYTGPTSATLSSVATSGTRVSELSRPDGGGGYTADWSSTGTRTTAYGNVPVSLSGTPTTSAWSATDTISPGNGVTTGTILTEGNLLTTGTLSTTGSWDQDGVASFTEEGNIDEFIKLDGYETQFHDTVGAGSNAGTMDSLRQGALYVIFRASINFAGTGRFEIKRTKARFRYYDP